MEKLVDGEAPDGGVEEFDHVEGGKLGGAAATKAVHELEQASGISADDSLRAGCEQVRDFSVAEFVGGLGMQQVVNACRAAAEIRFRNLFDGELGDLREQSAWLSEDTLRVAKVAGVVIGDAKRDGQARRYRLDGGKNFADVFAPGGECGGACGPRGVIA